MTAPAHLFRIALLALGLLAGLAACNPTPAPTPALTPVTVQLLWTHQAQFAGLYAADQNGYYAEEGLAVTFLEGGPQVDHLKSVQDGAAQFGIAGADQLVVARSQGEPLRAVATIFRRSPVVFVALADSGITQPEDFAGKSIRVTSNLIPSLHAMTARVGLASDQYTEVDDLPSDVALFASGEAPVWGMYVNAMAVAIRQAGYDINVIYPDDYGVHLYADTLFTTDDLIAQDPELVRRFLRATLKGWTWAVENPTQAGPLVVKYKPDADPDLEIRKMTASLPLVNTGEDHIGWMRPEIWAGMETTLREQGVLTAPVDVTQIYSLQFLEEIYP